METQNPSAYRSSPLADLCPLDHGEVERAGRRVVEVTVEWSDEILQVAHLGPGEDLSLGAVTRPGSHRVAADLGHASRVWTPVEVTASGARFHYFSDDLAALEVTEPMLHPDAVCRQTVHGITVTARWVAAGRSSPRDLPVAKGPLLAFLGSLLAVTLSVLALARVDTSWHRIAVFGTRFAPIAHLTELPSPSDAPPDGFARGGTGRRPRAVEGAMGSRDAHRGRARFSVARTVARGSDAAGASLVGRGIFRALGASGPASDDAATRAFASMAGARGTDQTEARGEMFGGDARDAFGAESLGRVGAGFGGGGSGEGTIGTGSLGTLGHGDGRGRAQGTGDGSGAGYGSGAGRGLRRRTFTPHGCFCNPNGHTDGTMPPEVIRRVVLQNLGQIRACQEQGMAFDPTLAGRVVVRFVVGSAGSVLTSQVSESTVAIPSVGECISRAVQRWQFPATHAGVLVVNYPFMLERAP